MGSKVFIFIGLLLAFVLLISSEVAARDLAETSADLKNDEVSAETNGVEDAKYGGGGYNNGGGGYNNGGGYRGGGGYNNGGGHQGSRGGGRRGGGGCRYGCCGGGYNYRRGCRCCTYAGEAETLGKPQN